MVNRKHSKKDNVNFQAQSLVHIPKKLKLEDRGRLIPSPKGSSLCIFWVRIILINAFFIISAFVNSASVLLNFLMN